MYRNLTYLKDIHIWSKVFSLFLAVFGVCIIQKSVFLLFLVFLFSFFFYNPIFFLVEVFLFFLTFFFSFPLLGMKILFLFYLLLLFFQTIDFQEVRYFIESLFYHQRKTKNTYICLYICYFCKYYWMYFREFLTLKKSYGKKLSVSFMKYVFQQSFYKTKDTISRFMLLYRYRFYNFSNKRTYVEKLGITSIDLKYLLIYVILFFFAFVYGR